MRLFIKPDAARLINNIRHILAEENSQSYLVGGFVRDMLLGRDTADIDIAVAPDALVVAPRVASALGGRYVTLDEKNEVGRIILPNNAATPAKGRWELDFTTLKGDIQQDLAQRDFTIDAMAIELQRIFPELLSGHHADNGAGFIASDDLLIDPFNGQDDIKRGVVRATSETAFKTDAARLLRAVRLAAELDFSIDCDTETLIRQYSHLIASVAGERVREELLQILAMHRAGPLMAYLDELGLLTALIPELTPARGVSQPTVHVWDVFDHSIQTVSAVELLLREGTWDSAGEEILAPIPWSTKLSEHFDQEVSSGSTRRSLLKLAALLHDIAKPQTKTVDEDGRARFLGHPQEGAAQAAAILGRLRFSTREIKLVELMVRHHLRPMQMSNEGVPTRRAIYRYFRDTGEAGIDILFLCLADHLATRGSLLDMAQWQEHAWLVEYTLTKHFEETSLSVPPKLIDGHDLMRTFGLSPGPRVGQLLEALRETQAAGEVSTRQQALSYVKKLLADQAHPSQNESTG